MNSIYAALGVLLFVLMPRRAFVLAGVAAGLVFVVTVAGLLAICQHCGMGW